VPDYGPNSHIRVFPEGRARRRRAAAGQKRPGIAARSGVAGDALKLYFFAGAAALAGFAASYGQS